MITSFVEVGMPLVQLAVLRQEVPAVPFQLVVCANKGKEKSNKTIVLIKE